VTLRWTDLILVLVVVAVGSAGGYVLLLRKLKQIVAERQLKIADQLGSLDDAIRALETRLAEHHALLAVPEPSDASTAQSGEFEEAPVTGESESIAPEIQAVIAAATVAALGTDVQVRAVKPVSSPWSQQGRVLVQGSHNARAGR
jgi:predicted trehalose synthase